MNLHHAFLISMIIFEFNPEHGVSQNPQRIILSTGFLISLKIHSCTKNTLKVYCFFDISIPFCDKSWMNQKEQISKIGAKIIKSLWRSEKVLRIDLRSSCNLMTKWLWSPAKLGIMIVLLSEKLDHEPTYKTSLTDVWFFC